MRYLMFNVIVIFSTLICFSQEKDTIYILFNDIHYEMKKGSSYVSRANDIKTVSYWIRQKEPANGYDNYFWFAHFNQPPKAYRAFGGARPLKIVKDTSFLRTITPLDIEFFRTTDYLKVCKTFEAEDSREQDVVIFMIDKDEIKEGKLLLREVKFSRPVKI